MSVNHYSTDLLRQGQAAYDSHNFNATLDKVWEALIHVRDCADQSQAVLTVVKSLEIIRPLLNEVCMNIRTFEDDTIGILRASKGILRYLDGSLMEHKNGDIEQMLKDLRTFVGGLDPLWLREHELASNLEALCDCAEDTEETARILSELASVNLKKSPDKSSLVKTCLFLKAALEKTAKKKREIAKEIKSVNNSILKASGAKSKIADLHEISQTIYKKKVIVMRENIATFFAGNDKLDNGGNFEDNDPEYVKYIEQMKTTMSTIWDNYVEVMNEISKKCVEILGEPPCKFSHMAMGPQATGEISGHSSMFSAIILDSDIKKKDSFSDVVEYFRWYSVIFQVIIIYFGETSLDLKYLSKKRRNLTLDLQQMNSLGRDEGIMMENSIFSGQAQSADEIELIKTVKDMTKLVSKSGETNEVRNFAVKLTRTRHVGGNESIHKKFQKRVKKIIYSKGSEADDFRKSLMTEKTKEQIQYFSFHAIFKEIHNIETSAIEMTSARLLFSFVDMLGHLAHIEKTSLFSNVNNLISKGHIGDKAGASLRLALAISSEIVLRSTNCVLSGKEIDKKIRTMATVNKKKLQALLLLVTEVQKARRAIVNSEGNIKILKGNNMDVVDIGEKAEILAHFGWFEDALSCIEVDLPNNQRWTNTAFVHFMRGLCLSKLGRVSEANDCLKLSLTFLASLTEADQAKIFHFVQYLIGINMLHMDNSKEAKYHLYQAKQALESSCDLPMHGGDVIYFQTLDALAEIEYREGDYHLACAKSKELAAICDSNSLHCCEIMSKSLSRQADCFFKLSQYDECISLLQSALERNELPATDDTSNVDSLKASWLVKLADCHFRLNQINLSEKYCRNALKHVELYEKEAPDILSQIKLIYSQCHLWQSRYEEASQEACEAILSCLDIVDYPKPEKLSLIQAAVTVISRSITPVRALNFGKTGKDADGGRAIISNASRVFDVLCEQTIFESNQLERDKSVLIRVIQSGLFQTNQYNKILNFCKCAVDDSLKESSEEESVTCSLINLISRNEILRDNCERDGDHLSEMGKFCNVRDAFSTSGAVIVYSGCLYRCSKDTDRSIMEVFGEWVSQQSDEKRNTVLHCAVKLAKYVVEYFLSKVKAEAPVSVRSKVPFLDFISDIYGLLKCSLSNDLIQETTSLVTNLASCWMKFQNYEDGLALLNDALQLQEKLAMDVTSVAYIDSSSIIQNIGICLAKLGRWEEANSYLDRGSAMKERRRRSRAYEDYSMIHARVKSGRCSFSLGNYQEAVFMASTAFHDGIVMDSIDNQDDSMISAVSIVLKSALAVSAHAQVEAGKARIQPEVIGEVLKRATAVRSTLEEQSELLGSAYAEMVESFYYACGNCLFVLGEYKQALKSFKKSVRIMKQKGNLYVGIKKPITLNIAKCLIGLDKYKKAEKSLHRFLAMENEKTLIIHLHHSHAHLLLSVCSIRRHFYRSGYDYVIKALHGALKTESEVLKQEIARTCTDVCLRLLDFEIGSLDLD